MTLQKWINEVGVQKVSQELGVTMHTVRLWQWRKVLPRAESMVKIHKYSLGLVTYTEIIEDFAKHNKLN